MLIFSLQNPHFPPRKIYERTGILCHHFSLFPHLGHLDGGNTIDSPLRVLKITTFKKLPIQTPVRGININNLNCSAGYIICFSFL